MPFKIRRSILACGADMKGAFALARGGQAYLYDGFGDLSDPDNLERYEKAVKSETTELGIKPAIVACDLHPGYCSTLFAERVQSTEYRVQIYKVQHHEAHVAAAIVDNSIEGDVIGVAFDGTGYGSDGNIWGGEFFVGSLRQLFRAGHFAYLPMPGGEAAIRQPYRMAVSCLYHAFGKKGLSRRSYKKEIKFLLEMIDKRINSPMTSSAGRLFDAIGSLVFKKDTVEKEAELPIELEKIAIRSCRDSYDFDIVPNDKVFVVDCKRLIKGVMNDLSKGVEKGTISDKFHNTIARIILETAVILRKAFKIDRVALSGGVFQNALLASRAEGLLAETGFRVFRHSRIQTGDSGIPIGQIAIANARQRCA